MLVRSFMVTRVVSTSEEASVADALALMEKKGFEALPVVRDRRPIGVVSARALYRAGDDNGAITSLIDTSIQPLNADDVLEVAIQRLLAAEGVLVPVVDERGRMAGILTRTDLLQGLLQMLGAEREGVRVTLLVPDTKGQIERIGRAADRNSMNILNLMTLPHESIGSQQVTLRLQGKNAASLVRDFESRRFKVLHAYKYGDEVSSDGLESAQ